MDHGQRPPAPPQHGAHVRSPQHAAPGAQHAPGQAPQQGAPTAYGPPMGGPGGAYAPSAAYGAGPAHPGTPSATHSSVSSGAVRPQMVPGGQMPHQGPGPQMGVRPPMPPGGQPSQVGAGPQPAMRPPMQSGPYQSAGGGAPVPAGMGQPMQYGQYPNAGGSAPVGAGMRPPAAPGPYAPQSSAGSNASSMSVRAPMPPLPGMSGGPVPPPQSYGPPVPQPPVPQAASPVQQPQQHYGPPVPQPAMQQSAFPGQFPGQQQSWPQSQVPPVPQPQMSPVHQPQSRMPPVPQPQMSPVQQAQSQMPPVPQAQVHSRMPPIPQPPVPQAQVPSQTPPVAQPHAHGHMPPVHQQHTQSPMPPVPHQHTQPHMPPVPQPHTQPQMPPVSQHAQGQMQAAAGGATQQGLLPVTGSPAAIAEVQPHVRVQASAMRVPTDSAYVRCTLGKIPRSAGALSKTRIPLGIVVTPHPRGRPAVPLVSGPIVRCRRCRTYVGPYAEVSDGGARWRCNVCAMPNDLPPTWDAATRPETHVPVYEYLAPADYMVRAPPPPLYVFVLDASAEAASSGVLAAGARAICAALDVLPEGAGRTLVALVTFGAAVHYYVVPGDGGEARMLVDADLGAETPPAPRDLVVDLAGARGPLAAVLERLPAVHAGARPGSCAGAALHAALRLASPTGGKVILVLGSRPSVGPGAVRAISAEEAARVLGTPREAALLQPADAHYKAFATDAQRANVCVDAFLFAPRGGPADAATLAPAATYTGGRVWHYADPLSDAGAFAADLLAHVRDGDVGLEAVLRVRATHGLALGAYHGACYLRSSDLLALPNVAPAHAFSAVVRVDESLAAATASFQAALLYTTPGGERRIRVVNAAFPVSDDPRELALSADGPALACLLLRMAAEKACDAGRLEDAREALMNVLADVSRASRSLFGGGSAPSAMLPAGLAVLPLAVLAMLKGDALRPGVPLDSRVCALAAARTLSVPDACDLLLPYVVSLHTLSLPPHPSSDSGDASTVTLPPALRLSAEVLERHGLYAMFAGPDVLLWAGPALHPELSGLVFGPAGPHGISPGGSLPELDNPWSGHIRALLAAGRARQAGGVWAPGTLRPTAGRVRVACDGGDPAARAAFLAHLVEDRHSDGLPSFPVFAAAVRERAA